jgi:hypothetical protein
LVSRRELLDWDILQKMTATITSVADLIGVANTVRSEWNGELWWRGQSSTAYDLIPGVYRANRGTRGEQNLCLRFRQYAQTRHDKCPQQDDFCSWLALAQHYGLPTRLLDWSESALVGLFFAANANPTLDASIYGLHPREMNKVTNGDHTLVPVTSSPANDLFRGAFDDRINPLSPPLRSPQQRPQGHPAKSKFLAVHPTQIWSRCR